MSEQDRPPIIPIPKSTPDGPQGGVIHRGINPGINGAVSREGILDQNRLRDAGLFSGRGQKEEIELEDPELQQDLQNLQTGTGIDYSAHGSQPRKTKD